MSRNRTDIKFLSTPSARRATLRSGRPHRDRRLFLSTPSARRATRGRSPSSRPQYHFYPRPPRGGRRVTVRPEVTVKVISIHALREEGDTSCTASHKMSRLFLSTPSARRATARGIIEEYIENISIHALREEGDWALMCPILSTRVFLSTPSARRATSSGCPRPSCGTYFYPRPPRGGRRC